MLEIFYYLFLYMSSHGLDNSSSNSNSLINWIDERSDGKRRFARVLKLTDRFCFPRLKPQIPRNYFTVFSLQIHVNECKTFFVS